MLTGRSPKGLVAVNAIGEEDVAVLLSIDVRDYKAKIEKSLGWAAVGGEFKLLFVPFLLMSISQQFEVRRRWVWLTPHLVISIGDMEKHTSFLISWLLGTT